MAKDCGIQMMESELFEESGRAHFMTKRFDREGNNTKHHIQTFCGIRHFDYNNLYGYSYEQLFQTMRMLRMSYPENIWVSQHSLSMNGKHRAIGKTDLMAIAADNNIKKGEKIINEIKMILPF